MNEQSKLDRLLGVAVERDVPCRMRDGATLYADVHRPEAPGEYPVLLMRSPYGKTLAESNVGYAHPAWYARQGYVVVIQDSRGSFASDGHFYPFEHEAEDGYDTIEWAARLPGADGRVATYGFSYPGFLQLQAAALRPPSLAAISPAFTNHQAYEGWTYNQGALSLAFVASWASFWGLEDAKRRRDLDGVREVSAALAASAGNYWGLPLADYPALTREENPYFFDWLEHPSYDDYWRRWSIDEDYGRVTVPALHIGGWYDSFIGGTVKNFVGLREGAGDKAARAGQKLLVGPWVHAPWSPIGGIRSDVGGQVVDDWQLRFFDQVLKGRDTGVFESPVTLFVQGAGWRDLEDWPSRSRSTSLFLHSGGRANSAFGDGTLSAEPPADEPADVFTYDPSMPTVSQGGHSCCVDPPNPMGPKPQDIAEAAMFVLVYTGAPLERDIDLIGDVAVTLHAATSARDTDFATRLCVVDEAGVSTNLQEGIVRARFRRSTSREDAIVPGEVYEYEIELGPVGVRIPSGHRLRLQVSSSDFPQWDRNLNTGGPAATESLADAVIATQVVLHDGAHRSRVELPIVA